MKLLLEDGTELEGSSFGADRAVAGEVVFSTAMTGYVETLTDPSFRGQILLLTYPLQGNYGVPAPRAADSLERPFESSHIQVQGLVVQSYVSTPSHATAARSLGQWLVDEDVPGITGIDTRALTQKLREHGTLKGWLLPNGATQDHAHAIDMQADLFRLVAPKEPIRYAGPADGPEVLLIDVGAKDNIVRSLLEHGASVTRAPWHADLAKLAQRADGVLLGNGPGDPKHLGSLIEQVRALLARGNLPIFGVCLGNQILALAAGGDTYKLPYGHRGVNQSVQDLGSRRCFVTSQNHGYAVSDKSLPRDFEPWFVNLNDGTNEGIRARFKPHFSVQFHPEAAPGPKDTGFLFDEFLRLASSQRSVR
ncbi:MAG: glutamine-hydrolyzing carbamoyl-phosphate synthase small subunit [Myxococcales bacterium]|nr:glutamine-hydrolyzing carbamoyl-phosphate synthase small subunit [Myxococcales bacterium]